DKADKSRLFVVEKEGAIKSITTKAGAQPTLFGDLSDRVAANGPEPGINGIAFHPSFPATNEVYIAYDAHNPNARPPTMDFEWILARVKTVRTADGFILDTKSEERLSRMRSQET